CAPAPPDISITKTDGVTAAPRGGTVAYTIVVKSDGLAPITGAIVTDTFPAQLTNITWSCVGIGGGVCGSASGTGNISQTVNLPGVSSVTYTALATILPTATGTVSNTATVAAPPATIDANPANNTATDTDT